MTPRRVSALRDLRAWERRRHRDDLDRARGVSGPFLRHRARTGSYRPWQVPTELRAELAKEIGTRAVQLLEHLVGAELGYRARCVVTRHEDLAALMGCSERTAGDAIRRLVELGLVERRAHFRPVAGGAAHAQLACSYRLRTLARRRLRLPDRKGGNSCQPTETHPSGSGKGAAGRCRQGLSAEPQGTVAREVGAEQALQRLQQEQERLIRRQVERHSRAVTEALHGLLARAGGPTPGAPPAGGAGRCPVDGTRDCSCAICGPARMRALGRDCDG